MEEKLENILNQQENHQCIIGMKKIMLFSLMRVFGCVQDITNKEMKTYLKLQREKLKMLGKMLEFAM